MPIGVPPRPELGFRARKILYAVVSEYVSTGEPVGSRTLARRYGLNLSPATIRNVLADLEDWGYLAQPHTSAGRIPTDIGFRLFVDALIEMREVSEEDRAAILARLRTLRPGDDVAREAGRVLSSLAGAAAVVTPPRPEDEQLAQVRFLPLRPGELLAVIVTRTGVVQNRAVRIGSELDPGELERLHNYLTELLGGGRTLEQVRSTLADEMASERGRYDQLHRRAKELIDAAVAGTDVRPSVVIEGQGVLFDRPEFADAEKIRSFLRTFEEKERLLELLDRTLAAGGFQVLIGAEAQLGDVQDISVISASFGRPNGSGGTLGVIGPARMDYAKVVPLVGFTARVLSELLAPDDGEEDPGTAGTERDSEVP
jgi:heat-inducible transcriptional repressor